jgi:hypothetical protein
MKHHLITVAILLAALAFYGRGMAQLGSAGIVIGGAFELWFWVRLVSNRASTNANRISE